MKQATIATTAVIVYLLVVLRVSYSLVSILDVELPTLRNAELDNVGAFTYSPEPGSGSEPLGDPVPDEEKERRKDFLLSLQQPIARGKLRALRVRALVEAVSTEVMQRVGRALGAGPLCHDQAHARRVADLTVYLRQHHAERNLAELGALVADSGASW